MPSNRSNMKVNSVLNNAITLCAENDLPINRARMTKPVAISSKRSPMRVSRNFWQPFFKLLRSMVIKIVSNNAVTN